VQSCTCLGLKTPSTQYKIIFPYPKFHNFKINYKEHLFGVVVFFPSTD
jgi:hypothetical protein